MAHFAEIDENNVVIRVVVVPNEEEHRGNEFLSVDLGLGGRWEKTSYNTRGGVYYDPETNMPDQDQSKAYRKNFAGQGFIFHPELDGFSPPKPFDSFILDPQTFSWLAPIPKPDDGEWRWNEEIKNWEEVYTPFQSNEIQ